MNRHLFASAGKLPAYQPAGSRRYLRHVFAFVLIAIVASIPFAMPLAQGRVFSFRDHADYFQPLRWHTAQVLRGGELPLWNPYSGSGEAWLANPQTGVFYPPAWLFLALPFPAAYMLFLLVHLVILGWGAYLLFARKASHEAALVGAVAIVFSGPVLSLLDVSNNLTTFAWIPLVLWCALECRPLHGAFALAMAFLGGEPFFAGIAALLFVIANRKVKWIAVTGAIAFALCAIQLLPFLELLMGSDRTGLLSRKEMFRDSMKLVDWLRVAVPPSLPGGYDAALSQHFIPMIYVGVPVALFALIAWVTSLERRDVLAWTALLVVAAIIAAGRHLPPVAWFFDTLPLTLFRYPARLVPFGALALVALAVIGWDRIRPKRRWVDLLVIGIIAVDLVPRAAPLLRTHKFSTTRVPYDRSVGAESKILRIDPRPVRHPAWIGGYQNLFQRRFDAATAAPVIDARYLTMYDWARFPESGHLRSLMSVGYIASRFVKEFPPEFERVARVAGVRVFHHRNVPPMATFRTHATSAPDLERAFRDTLEGKAWRTLLVTPGVDPSLTSAAPAIHRVQQLELGPSHARVVVAAPSRGLVYLSQRHARGWRVEIDGKPATTLVAGGLFRAVEIEKGRHEVMWRYRPASFFAGAVITITTLAVLLLRVFVKRRRERNFSSLHLEQE